MSYLYSGEYFVRKSVEEANIALHDPHLLASLGDAGSELLSLLDRIVPVASQDDVARIEATRDGSSIPFIVTESGVAVWPQGANLFTDKQSQALRDKAELWQPTKFKADEVASGLEMFAEGSDPAVISQPPGVSSDAAANSHALLFTRNVLSKHFGFNNPPSGTLTKIDRRPFIVTHPGLHDGGVDADLLIHELVHVIQYESDPVSTLTSDQDLWLDSFGREVEAYYYGAKVVLALLGIGDVSEASQQQLDSSIQLQVEKARVGANAKVADLVPMSHKVMRAFATNGMAKERIVGTRPNLAGMLSVAKAAEIALIGERKLPPKARERGGRTTPRK